MSIFEMNPLAFLWCFLTVAILFGYFVLFYPEYFPEILRKLYPYGKTSGKLKVINGKHQISNQENGLYLWILIPKRYFSHFYLFATCYAAVATSVLLTCYYHHNAPKGIIQWLDIVAGESRSTNVSSVATICAMLLFVLHVMRRAYESMYISVYSASCKMNVIHYTMGIVFYFAVVTSLLAEAPGFTKEGFNHKSFQQAYNWRWHQVCGTAFYFWAIYHQNKCATILANLRKDKKGQVVNQQHRIPMGDWFEFVSNPHFFAEILIYTSLNIILEFQNSFIILATIFTVTNQVLAGLMGHKWYLQTFSDYPKDRKAVIPFVI